MKGNAERIADDWADRFRVVPFYPSIRRDLRLERVANLHVSISSYWHLNELYDSVHRVEKSFKRPRSRGSYSNLCRATMVRPFYTTYFWKKTHGCALLCLSYPPVGGLSERIQI